jgi:hypothetical protein
MSSATDKTDIKAWLMKASRAIYIATDEASADDISDGLLKALARIAELENQLEGAEQRGALILDVIAERDRLAAQNNRIALAFREFEAEQNKWKAAAEARFTKSVL